MPLCSLDAAGRPHRSVLALDAEGRHDLCPGACVLRLTRFSGRRLPNNGRGAAALQVSCYRVSCMRRRVVIMLAVCFLLGLIAVASWPGPPTGVKLSVTPLGLSSGDRAKFIVGITNNSHRTREVLAARGIPTDRGMVMADPHQRAVLGPGSGTLVTVQTPQGTSSWTLIVWHRGHDGRVESTLRSVGWRLKVCRAYSSEFARWTEIKMDIPR